ncbi:hypothetical protein [Klebsiella pneumoniae]
MPSRGAVANLTLATSETWRDKQTGECAKTPSGTVLSCSASSRSGGRILP